MCNKFARGLRTYKRLSRRRGRWNMHGFTRDVKIAQPTIAERFHIGEVVRHGSLAFVHNMEGRRTNTGRAALMIEKGWHHQGKNFLKPGCTLPFPSHVRFVYLDKRKIRWCWYNSAAFHSFVWPSGPSTLAKEAKAIVRMLIANHCKWSGVLIVRGRCFGKRKENFYVNMVLDVLFLRWVEQGRPFIVYSDGSDDVGGLPEGCGKVEGDLLPTWFGDDNRCVCGDLCQCNLLGRNKVFHHPGRLCYKFLRPSECSGHPSLACTWSKVKMKCSRDGFTKHSMGDCIAAVLSRVAIASVVRHRSHPAGGRFKLEIVEPTPTRRGALCRVDPRG